MPGGWPGDFDRAGKKYRISEIESVMAGASFWTDRARADLLIKELGQLQDEVEKMEGLDRAIQDLKEDYQEDKYFKVRKLLRSLEVELILKGKYDSRNAILSIFPGAGGDDATDWASMLFSMYEKFASAKGWKTVRLEDSANRRAMEIIGKYAYGLLRLESGVHRLVRISPFNAKKQRHTSFALVEVLPDLPELEESQISIPEKDLKIEFSRSGGPGGQNVNKVETAVRMVHIPTGISSSCDVERSQSQNRETALRMLKAKLFSIMKEQKVEELSALKSDVKVEWGSQIRSYVLNPYQLVKDHRTGAENPHTEGVLNGGLDDFIDSEIELLGADKE